MNGNLGSRIARRCAALALAVSLSGCGDYRLAHPLGPVADIEWNATLIGVAIMLLLILPVTVLIGLFAWRYRKSGGAAYDPEWSHSLVLEVLVWGVPFAIVAVLGYLSIHWVFATNPYGPAALDAPATVSTPALDVDVIATDWQWIFVYPAQHIATIDELTVPVGRRVNIRLTSTSVMNDFFIPQLAPMIDVMPGMRTEDAFEADKIGDYEGFSADFSGAGFSWMQFATHVVSPNDFTAWTAKVAASPTALTYAAFQKIARPTVNEGAKPAYFTAPDTKLFEEVYDAALDGVTYPVPASLTKSIADNEGKSP